MKRICMIFVCWVAILAAGTSIKAQEATITLMPGWTWIGYPKTEALDLAMALGDFVPMEGDIIKSQYGFSQYQNGEWSGNVLQLGPSLGYQYFSNRTEIVVVSLSSTGSLPTVITSTPTDITTYGMTCGGEVTDSGNSGVLVRGVCWSTQQNPTINDSHTTDGYGIGNFSSAVEGLEMNTTYYVRAYALTTSGAGYGEQKMFSTKNGIPTLTTSAASEIGVTWATCGGDISDDGGIEVTERGICWSTAHNPTIAGDHGSNGAGLGSFSVNMNGLEANTTYYVRAYATNSHTTAYGNEVSFRTEVAQTWPNGKLPGQFSVSATHQVRFSQGNLQYIGSAATPYWRFAEHQWDYIGIAQNGAGQDIDRDLFGWGTSGWNNGNMYYQPYDTDHFWDTETGYGYGPTDGTDYNFSLTGDYANADWGVYNPILNGGNASQQWRTLTYSEWNYVLYTRTTSSGIRYAKAQVYGVNGVVLLPDDWDASLYTLNYTNNSQAPFDSNVIADSDWVAMETYGSVFLPAAGYKPGTSVSSYHVGSCGYYWSTSYYNYNNYSAYHIRFDGSNVNLQSSSGYRYYGYSVRLVSVTLPEVSTGTVNDVSCRAAIVSGNVIEDGNADISACGICCSTSSNPTTDDMVALAQNTIVGELTVTLNGLTPNTTYYARAFASNSAGTAYGDEISFTTLNISTWTNGILPGAFSVSADQQVNFSQGNLQYIGSAITPYWQFAENQWDYLGTTTGQNSSNQDVDRDLFGYGTSGYSHGANCYQPWSTSGNYSDYFAYGSVTYNLNDSTGMADWGYNPISNGGNQENQWRTLTYDEWRYLLFYRTTTSGIRYASAQVFGINGFIILPDDWNATTYNLNNTNNSYGAPYSSNVLTVSQWATLESAGAVFLPAAGYRNGTSVGNVSSCGYYRTASYYDSGYARHVFFDNSSISTNSYFYGRSGGLSVRLVRSIPVYSIEATPNPAEGGTVTGLGNYNSDATCTLIATPNEGYVFNNWTENGTVVSIEASYSFTVTNDRTLVANFIPQGAINGQFTINANGDKVYFSMGNLQYQASTNTWRFATNQYDCIGNGNSNISQTYSGWIDLFGWGTSGYNHGANCYQPWSTSTNNSDYYAYGNWQYNLYDANGQADWGYNSISGTTGSWRTLTLSEWNYVFNTRTTTSGIRYAKANVNNVNGIILLPDDWNSSTYSLSNTNSSGASFSSNTLAASQWSALGQAGAVFLPAAGIRGETSVSYVGSRGYYWSASLRNRLEACYVDFNDLFLYTDYGSYRFNGQSVRLVCPAE